MQFVQRTAQAFLDEVALQKQRWNTTLYTALAVSLTSQKLDLWPTFLATLICLKKRLLFCWSVPFGEGNTGDAVSERSHGHQGLKRARSAVPNPNSLVVAPGDKGLVHRPIANLRAPCDLA